MKRKLRIRGLLALLLAAGMLSVPAGAFADVSAGSPHAQAAEYVQQVGLMVGDEKGNFNPDLPVTRAEMAVILCRMLGKTEDLSVSNRFPDVAESHWANAYIGKVAELGIVNGYGSGMFGPGDHVSYEQAVTMVIRAVGAGEEAALRGGYPDGFLQTASNMGLLNSIQSAKGEDLNRANVALLLYNYGKNYGAVVGDPGEGPGEDPGEVPGDDPGEAPGEMPGEDPGQAGGDLAEVCPPYQTSGGYEVPERMVMCGDEYTRGVQIYNSGSALFNLKGAYQTLEFDAGHVDTTAPKEMKLSIYLDGVLTQEISIDSEALVQHYTVSLNGASQMKLEWSSSDFGLWSCVCGLANAVIY